MPENILDYLHIASFVVAVASAIAAVTPSPVDDGLLLKARQVLDILAFNWGHATNATQKQFAEKADRS